MDATYEEMVTVTSTNNKSEDMFIQLQAGFWPRFWAYCIDLIVISSINRILIYPFFQFFSEENIAIKLLEPSAIVTAVIFFAYFLFMTKFFNQTLGKMIMGIKVVPLKTDNISWGTLIFREVIGRYISKTIWVGYLIVPFTPNKQGLHDIFADTKVVHEKLYQKKQEKNSAD